MTRQILKATTAIAVALALSTPHASLAAGPGALKLAQASGAAKPESPGRSGEAPGRAAKGEAGELCEDGSQPPCGAGAEPKGEEARAAEAEAEAVTEEPAAEAAGAAEAAPREAEAAAAGEPEAEEPRAETAAEAEPAEPAAEAQAERPPEPTAEAEAQAETQAEVEPETEPGAAAEAQTEAEAQAEAQPETEPKSAAEVAQPAEAAEASGQVTEPEEAEAAGGEPAAEERAAEAEDRAEPGAEAQAERETLEPEQRAAEEAVTEEAATGETAAEAPAAAEPTEEAEAVTEEEAPAAAAAEAPEAESTAEGAPPTAEAEPSLAAQADEGQAGEGQAAEEPAAAQAETAEGETAEAVEPVEVTTETVTEETTRTSDEEFAEPVAERGDDDDDDDIDDIIKILGAAGAGLAAGALLSGGGEVVDTTGDRVIIERDGQYFVRKDENELLRRPGSEVRTETFADGSTRTVVERDNGVRVVTIRDPYGYIVRRTRIMPDGREIVLFDDVYEGQGAVDVPPPQLDYRAEQTVPHRRYVDYTRTDRVSLRETLQAPPAVELERSYTLRQVREYEQLRELMPRLDLDNITFDLGSAAITPDQARELHVLGQTMSEILENEPDEVFLIEGYTDAVGGRVMNLALSDRRAETVALALTEYYDIPPENLITQGYGEEYLKIETQAAERANRRVTVRRITPLIEAARAR